MWISEWIFIQPILMLPSHFFTLLKIMFRFFLTCLLLTGINSYSNPALQRRSFVSKAGNTIARVGIFGVGLETGLGGPRAAWASEEVDRVTTRMGGLLEKVRLWRWVLVLGAFGRVVVVVELVSRLFFVHQ